MKIIILVFILFPACLALAQQERKDSFKAEASFHSVDEMISKFDDFEFYRQLNFSKNILPANVDSNTIRLWTSFALSGMGYEKPGYEKIPLNVAEFLYKDYIEQSKFNPVKYALGALQAGAVGYLAYRHIKKYGFLK